MRLAIFCRALCCVSRTWRISPPPICTPWAAFRITAAGDSVLRFTGPCWHTEKRLRPRSVCFRRRKRWSGPLRTRPIRPLGGSRVAELDGPRAAGAAPLAAVRLGREEYALRREECLAPYPHAAYPDAFYRLMDEYGNLFLSFPGALAAVVPLENRCVVSALLCTGADPARVIAGITGLCPAERYEVRTPVFFPGPGEVRPFVYCHDPAGALSVPVSFWYAFGLE